MGDGKGVHPDAPTAPLVLDGVVEQDAEDGVHHLRDFLLLGVSRVDEAQGEHPLLPHRALQQAPETIKGAQLGEAEKVIMARERTGLLRDVFLRPMKRCYSYLRFSRLLLNSLIMSERKALRTSRLSGDEGEFFTRAAITFRISATEKIKPF